MTSMCGVSNAGGLTESLGIEGMPDVDSSQSHRVCDFITDF
jgi:hypothetical protein